MIKYFSARFSFYKQLLFEQKAVFLKANTKMGKKQRGVTSGNGSEDFLENKENIEVKDESKKYFSKCSDKSFKNNVSAKSKRMPKEIESIEKANSIKEAKLIHSNDSVNVKKIKEEPISCDSIENSNCKPKKQDIPKISNQSEYKFHDSFIMKECVVLLERCEDIKEETTCLMSYDYSPVALDDVEKVLNEPKCEFHVSPLMKNAVVILERYENIQKDSMVLEDGGKVKQVPNKSGKGTKRKRVEKGKNDKADSSKSKKQKDSGPSKSKKREDIPDVSAIDFNNDSKSPSGNLWNFKISSWNVNGIRAWLEKNGLSYLHHEQPDIMCIQETKCSDDKLPDEMKNVEGYHAYWLAGDKEGYSGVGLLTKEKPIEVKYGIDVSEHDNEGRVITAEYDKFYLVTTYVPNAGRGLVRLDYRMEWDKDFRDYLKKLDAKKPVILCGDLNVAHEEIDLANPKTNKKNAGFTKEEREGFSTLLKEGSFIDTYRHLYPDVKGAYTFWTYMMNARAKNVGWRLDYFVISERFTENLCDNAIRKDVFGSDHCPVTLFLSL